MIDLPSGVSIQEHYLPDMTCFGCGPANPKGLQLHSFPDGDRTVASFHPWPEHNNGLGYLNGGIICTVMDCHSATPMILEAAKLGLAGPGDMLPFVTAGLDVRYLRPTPLDETLQLFAAVAKLEESVITIDVELEFDGKTRAAGTAVWKRWRPR